LDAIGLVKSLRGRVSGKTGRRRMSEIGLSRCSQLESCVLWRILDATRLLAAPMGVDEILQKTIASALQFFDAERRGCLAFE
jgi:hypothetical protein